MLIIPFIIPSVVLYAIIHMGYQKVILPINDGWEQDRFHEGKKFRYKSQSQCENYLDRSDVKSFYVTNFPESILPSDMWRACSRLGRVTDVFISNKKS